MPYSKQFFTKCSKSLNKQAVDGLCPNDEQCQSIFKVKWRRLELMCPGNRLVHSDVYKTLRLERIQQSYTPIIWGYIMRGLLKSSVLCRTTMKMRVNNVLTMF
jgi:hypothetical protein